jgi:hypothetical protein
VCEKDVLIQAVWPEDRVVLAGLRDDNFWLNWSGAWVRKSKPTLPTRAIFIRCQVGDDGTHLLEQKIVQFSYLTNQKILYKIMLPVT